MFVCSFGGINSVLWSNRQTINHLLLFRVQGPYKLILTIHATTALWDKETSKILNSRPTARCFEDFSVKVLLRHRLNVWRSNIHVLYIPMRWYIWDCLRSSWQHTLELWRMTTVFSSFQTSIRWVNTALFGTSTMDRKNICHVPRVRFPGPQWCRLGAYGGSFHRDEKPPDYM